MRGSWKSLAIATGVSSALVKLAFATPTLVERADNSTAATFVYSHYQDAADGNFTFTISVNPANNDLWFRMSAPSEYSYIAVGTGSGMSGSTMFIAYQASDSSKVTLSARKSTGNVEPSYYKDLGLNIATPIRRDPHPNGISDGLFYVAGQCSNCTGNAGIIPDSKSQAFIFAVGPPAHSPRSDSPSAPLRRHALYGQFSLDMTQANGVDLPPLGTSAVGVASQGTITRDHERDSSGHALVMCLAFVIVFPIGIFMLRVLEKINLHMYAQSFGLFLVLIGFITGIIMSKTYNRSREITNPHQIIGIIVFILLLAQWVLGFLHHRAYLRTQQSTWMIKPHKYGLGPITMILGIANAALGFKFALAGAFNLAYVPIVVVVFIMLIISIVVKRFLVGRNKRSKGSVPFSGPGPTYEAGHSYGNVPFDSNDDVHHTNTAYHGGYGPASGDIGLSNLGQPPSYSQQPTKPRDMI